MDKQQGKKNFDRGRNFEYRIVYRARKMGLESHRTERSGAGEEKGDVVIEDRHHECKYRSDDSGLKTLYGWFLKAKKEECKGLIIKVKEESDGDKEEKEERPCLIVLEVDDYLSILEERKINKNGLITSRNIKKRA